MPSDPSLARCEDETIDGDLLPRFSDEAWRDWTRWEVNLPLSGDHPGYVAYPLLGESGSVPTGWRQISLTTLGERDGDFALCRHPRGLWVVVRREPFYPQMSRLHVMRLTLDALYNEIREDALDPTRQHPTDLPVLDWLRGLLLVAYDPINESEAAAATIVALGGPATMSPRKLH